MKLTENFSLHEFAASADHPNLAAKIAFSEEDKVKLFYLCKTILQPLRDEFGSIKILSGKRSSDLNTLVGGSVNSDHLFKYFSCAADFHVDADCDYVKTFLKTFCRNAWGQLILYPERKFVHISLPTPKHFGEVLIK